MCFRTAGLLLIALELLEKVRNLLFRLFNSLNELPARLFYCSEHLRAKSNCVAYTVANHINYTILIILFSDINKFNYKNTVHTTLILAAFVPGLLPIKNIP